MQCGDFVADLSDNHNGGQKYRVPPQKPGLVKGTICFQNKKPTGKRKNDPTPVFSPTSGVFDPRRLRVEGETIISASRTSRPLRATRSSCVFRMHLGWQSAFRR